MESLVIQVLVQAGVPGVVLGWFMLRAERRMDRIEGALNRMTRTVIVDVLSRPNATAAAKEQARAILNEIPAPPPAAPQLVEVARGGV